ncbi:glutathione S-transferase family protein [Frigidibacter mobilis]|uniref:glutathione transferase n=1 Tax=Frigidibacter mobilis TaxID=1335048 RepID=A0A159YYM1_9RHOB|nr:glutathione S-transferase family protein [Frigidibacter mobilis]AMY67602.1 glutathione S-transferase family protein [Frigidibacter mobilis]
MIRLTGYRYSIYTRIARLALIEKGVAHELAEADPFADPPPADLLALNPFGRVPVLEHDGFVLYETAAILRYVDAGFPGPALVPVDPRAAARMTQVIGIADAHAYWPLVRQVYAQLVFRPFEGLEPDAAEVAAGLAAAGPVLDALEAIAAEGLQLAGGPLSLADLHLAPMIAAFASAPEGAALLAARPALARWWHMMARRGSMAATTRTGR